MRKAPALALAFGIFALTACDATPDQSITEPELITAEAAPAGFGTCMSKSLKEQQKGNITPGSCLFSADLDRRSAYYDVTTPPAGQMLTLTASPDMDAIFGIKQDTQDPTQGIVWGSLAPNAGGSATMRFVGASPTQQVFVSNRNPGERGKFELSSSVAPFAYQCGIPTVLEAPVSFSPTIDDATACHWTIEYTPFPEALGKPLLGHFFNVKLVPGQSYELRVEGLSGAFNPAFTLYFGGAVAAQSVGAPPAGGVRTLTVTPTTLGYWGVEISSGQPDGLGGWLTPGGTYTLSITPL